MTTELDVMLVVIASFAPPYLYAQWLRNAEVYQRESMTDIDLAFALGAVFSFLMAFAIESVVVSTFFNGGVFEFMSFWFPDTTSYFLLMALVVAPLVEEGTKGLGILFFRERFREPGKGLVLGAVIGLGFAGTENILFGFNAIETGIMVFITIMAARVLTTTVMHSISTALIGSGMTKVAVKGRLRTFLPLFVIAVLLHAGINLLFIVGVWSGSLIFGAVGLVAAFIIVWTIMWRVQKQIKRTDSDAGMFQD